MNRKQRNHQLTLQPSQVTAPNSPPAGNGAASEAAFAAAMQHLQAGEVQQAAALLESVLKAEPGNTEALHLLGGIALRTRRHDVAADLFAKAIACRPDFAEAHGNLGIALAEQGKLGEAAASFRQAIALEPNVTQFHNNLGNALKMQHKDSDAATAYQKAIALEPDYADAHTNLGLAFKNLGKLEEAAAAHRKAIEIKPNYVEAHFNLGGVLKRLGRLDEAVASYRKAIALKPDFAKAHTNLGNALKEQGKLDEAVASCQRAVALRPDYAAAYSDLGFALDRQGKLEAALACYHKAIALDPLYANKHYLHARDHRFFPGDPEIEKLRRLAKLEGISAVDKSPIFAALGKAHDDIGRYREAFSYYSTANEGMAQRGDFDPSRHRKAILEVKEMFRERRGSADRDVGGCEHVPVFVVGMSRSGKTSVESLLAQHESVYGAGESMEWQNALMAVLDEYSLSTSLPEGVGSLSDDQMREIGEIYMRNIMKNSPGSRLFVNTLPDNDWYIGTILQAFPMAKIIYCRRDAMDLCLLVYFYRYKTGNHHSYDLSHLASYYADHHDLMVHWQRLYGDRILSVRYEDLVRNPTDQAARIYEFCDLDYDPEKVSQAFTTDEIGYWKNYEPYLEELRQALGGLAK